MLFFFTHTHHIFVILISSDVSVGMYYSRLGGLFDGEGVTLLCANRVHIVENIT